ncbi:D-amino acid dehydrogenase [Noviherbaspirillum cavernae]|uniref:D-amino acid dehydrogenase n=1 Tax=Noviherbaspirillum cavernae TaxID=2320862 RepID=A0A418WWA1_9BURK|nr:D-amino acid dehydrogenase [Noviherbaspirillum cavernae]RJF96984.1 D-amino acid dehydrogenase [Noviherbaspirillum cavernae]
MHICVLGAGVIGTTSAWKLLEAGHQVTMLDAMPAPGAGVSFGNGAQLSYSYVAPLADPSVWKQWPYYMFSSTSPLTLKFQADPAQWRWLLDFLAACNAHSVQKTTIDLLHLAYHSRSQLRLLQDAIPFDFLHRVAGKLVMFSSEKSLQAAQRQVDFQAQHGSRQEVIDIRRCVEIEPALQAAAHRWAGGVYTPSEEAGDCALFCRRLVDAMAAKPGFRFMPSTAVTGMDMRNGRLSSVQTAGGRIEAEAFVLAMGVESAAFARKAGFRLPVYPLKGYSITVPLNAGNSAAPQVSITDLSRKIVYARLGDRLRVAGRVELVGMNRDIPDRAVNELSMAVEETFPGSIEGAGREALSPWTGFRPATPSGVPIIDVSPISNLYLNVGHGALGWTLACGSADMLAHRIAGETMPIDDAPFRFRA